MTQRVPHPCEVPPTEVFASPVLGNGVYYPDLNTECQIARGPRVRAIGWLAADHPFSRGEVDGRIVEVLATLRDRGWVHLAVAGPHLCELCRQEREARNIFVPFADVLYVAPAMVIHYLVDHAYLPPSEFCTAVRECPEPTTDAYYAMLLRFLDVYSASYPMTAADFDRSTREHRQWRAQARREDATQKRGLPD